MAAIRTDPREKALAALKKQVEEISRATEKVDEIVQMSGNASEPVVAVKGPRLFSTLLNETGQV